MFASGLAGVLAQVPAGALIALACIAIVRVPTRPVIIGAQSFIGVAGAVFGPAVAAISLGLVGRRAMDARAGRNTSWSSAGNIGLAVGAGLIGYYLSREVIFYFVAGMSLCTVASVLCIREADIDHDLARGADDRDENVSGVGALLADKRVLIFALSVVGFHFANAALLTRVTQLLSTGKNAHPSLMTSACIVTAQLVIVPLGFFVGRRAQISLRKPIYLVAFAVLPLRCGLYLLSHNGYYLVALQALDGLAGGIFGIMQLLMVADLTRGTGRFNITQGALGMAVGIGASLSNLLAGVIVKHASYNAAFATMGAIALAACALFFFLVPETKPDSAPASEVALAPA